MSSIDYKKLPQLKAIVHLIQADSPLSLVRDVDRCVQQLQRMVVISLLLASIGTATLVYCFARQPERQNFSTFLSASRSNGSSVAFATRGLSCYISHSPNSYHTLSGTYWRTCFRHWKSVPAASL
jgi:hypothetical protein